MSEIKLYSVAVQRDAGRGPWRDISTGVRDHDVVSIISAGGVLDYVASSWVAQVAESPCETTMMEFGEYARYRILAVVVRVPSVSEFLMIQKES